MIALIDADIVAYRCSASAENDPLEVALFRIDDLMRRILHETNSQEYLSFLSGSNNFRYSIYPEYKANRKDKPKPKHLEDCKEHLIKQWNSKVTDGIEADDALGIEQGKHLDETIICSIDKDLLQIPGKHYNFVKLEHQTVSPLQGLRNFYSQVIEGDATDNIPAFDGKFRNSRPKFVQKLLDPLEDYQSEEGMYTYCTVMWAQGLGLEKMHQNINCLYIQKQEGDTWKRPTMTDNGVQEDSAPSFVLHCGMPPDDGDLSINA